MPDPVATNSLNSLGVFYNREAYRDNIYPSGSIPTPIDIWYEKPLYGRIDNNNNPIFISETFLKQFKQKENQDVVFGANFVVDAFEDFRKQMALAESKNRIDPESVFLDLKVESGWKNVNELYHSYIKIIFEAFTNTYIKAFNREEKILDFNSFISIFIGFIDSICPTFPLTKSAFITSVYCAPEISGLVIQLKDENHSLDQIKFQKYINDSAFIFLSKTARKYGFLIDKNAPWRLIADLGSPAMVPYLNKYNITNLNDFFNKFYYRSFTSDIDILKIYIREFYNSIVDDKPTITLSKVSNTIKDKTIFEHFKRNRFDNDNKDYDFNFWNKIYIYIRSKEKGLIISQVEFDRFVQIANEVQKTLDKQKTLAYINSKFSVLPPNITNIKTRTDNLNTVLNNVGLIHGSPNFTFF